jgi:hypothetical protein
MGKATASLTFDDTKEAIIKLRDKGLIEEFSLVGRLNTLYAQSKSALNIDIVDLMDILPKSANSLFKMIKDQLDYRTNEATLTKPTNTNEQKKRSYAINTLKLHKVVKKTGQRSFIVNPYLILPQKSFQETIIAKWDSLP